MLKLSIKVKILLACFVWSLLSIVSGLVVYKNQDRQNVIQGKLEYSKEIVSSFNDLLLVTLNLETGIRGYLLGGEQRYLDPFSESEAKFDQLIERTEKLMAGDSQKLEILAKIKELKQQWMAQISSISISRKKLERKLINYEDFVTDFRASAASELITQIRLEVDKIKKIENDTEAQLMSESSAAARQTKMSVILGLPLSILLGLGLMLWTVKSLNEQLFSLTKVIKSCSDRVTEMSREISNSSNELKVNADNASTSLQNTTSAMIQINAMTSKTSESAFESEQSSEQSAKKVEDGKHKVEQMVHSIEEIRSSNQLIANHISASNKKMTEIVGIFEEIGDKTRIINQIVFQTKLLSFNASVEAARAGERGKGFAVVAEEIGNLAKVSGQAAEEISTMLKTNLEKVENIVEDAKRQVDVIISTGSEKVKIGVENATECTEALDQIVHNVLKVSELTKSISQASKEQERGIVEINQAIGQLDASAKQNAAVGEKSAETAQELLKQADELDMAVGQLYGVLSSSVANST